MVRESSVARLGSGIGSSAPYVLLVSRVVLGVLFVMHGLPKFAMMDGFSGMLGSMGVPAAGVVGPLVALVEVIGGALLIAGLGSTVVGLLLAGLMLVTTVMVKLPSAGIIAPQGGAGAELDIAFLLLALIVATVGPGALALDSMLFRRKA